MPPATGYIQELASVTRVGALHGSPMVLMSLARASWAAAAALLFLVASVAIVSARVESELTCSELGWTNTFTYGSSLVRAAARSTREKPYDRGSGSTFSLPPGSTHASAHVNHHASRRLSSLLTLPPALPPAVPTRPGAQGVRRVRRRRHGVVLGGAELRRRHGLLRGRRLASLHGERGSRRRRRERCGP